MNATDEVLPASEATSSAVTVEERASTATEAPPAPVRRRLSLLLRASSTEPPVFKSRSASAAAAFSRSAQKPRVTSTLLEPDVWPRPVVAHRALPVRCSPPPLPSSLGFPVERGSARPREPLERSEVLCESERESEPARDAPPPSSSRAW